MSKKAGIVIGAVLVIVVAAAAGFVALTGGKDEAYRSIMVYQVEGNATITRASVGEMEAYENLMLQSGDSVAVASESSLRLKLDDDKYLLAEQETRMNIVAEGDGENAKHTLTWNRVRLRVKFRISSDKMPPMRSIPQTLSWRCVEQYSVWRPQKMREGMTIRGCQYLRGRSV